MWQFRIKPRNEKIRDPIQGAFFTTEAVAGPAQALVREAIQNSLDARNGDGPVRVRFWLSADEHALTAEDVSRLFEGTWEHYAAEGNGLHAAPEPQSSCSYLVVEDFGTNGLTGDPSQADPEPGVKNPFFLFFRAEGLSAKAGTELGRWGVGKFVFPRSSLASTHFGVTVRADDSRHLLLGAVTLKTHRIGPVTYSPDALFGTPDRDGFVLPFSERALLDDFSSTFNLSRIDQPGLSVVVPFLDTEITFESLLVAVARNWFIPLLTGDLEVTIESPGRRVVLDSSSLERTLEEHAEAVGTGVIEYVRLARWGAGLAEADRLQLLMPDPARAARWSADLVPDNVAAMIRQRLESRQAVAVRVPLTIRPKGKPPAETCLDIYLRPDRSGDGRPLFVREGILVSDVRGARASEIRSLVLVDDRPLATLLGDSESPAHTEWQKDGLNFRDRYTYGKAVIGFVTSSVAELLGIVSRNAAEADPSLTVDFFSIEAPEASDPDELETVDQTRRKPEDGDTTEVDHPEIEHRRQRVAVTRIAGGFTVASTEAAPTPPYLVELRCAYNVRSGNPLKKWVSEDFDLAAPPVQVTCDTPGVSVHSVKGNWLLLRVDAPSIRATVTGFDEARDLYVRYDVRERDASPEI